MKKIFLLCFALFSLGVSAQEGASAVNQSTKSETANMCKFYNRVYAGYGVQFISLDGYYNDSEAIHGGQVGWIHGISLTKRSPLYIEFGMGLGFYRKTGVTDLSVPVIDETTGTFRLSSYSLEEKYSMVRISVPINLTYRIQIDKNVMFAPYVGFTCHFNVLNEEKVYVHYDLKFLNITQMKGADIPAEASQTGYGVQGGFQVGFNLKIKKFNFGAEYGIDMSNVFKNTKSSHFCANIGCEF